jgi:hypothetical protein
MTSTWLVITSAAAFGYLVTALPLAHVLGRRHVIDISREPLAALTVQAIALWISGTSAAGASISIAAGFAAMFIVMKLRKGDGS